MKFTVRTVDVHLEVPFQISRAVRTEKRVVLVELDEGGRISRGENRTPLKDLSGAGESRPSSDPQ